MITADRLWSVQDVADFLAIPVQTLYRWRSQGYGPPGSRMGKHVRYVPDDVRAWVESLREDVA